MPLPRFEKLQVEDEVLNRVQDRAKVALNALANVPLMNGVLLEGVVLASGAFTPVAHGLTKPWRGWLIVSKNANANVWNQAPSNDSGLFLYLQPSANVTVNLWVF